MWFEKEFGKWYFDGKYFVFYIGDWYDGVVFDDFLLDLIDGLCGVGVLI